MSIVLRDGKSIRLELSGLTKEALTWAPSVVSDSK